MDKRQQNCARSSRARNGDDLILNMPATSRSRPRVDLTRVTRCSIRCRWSPTLDKTLIDVEGHTDNVGDNNYNQNLSAARGSVGSYLQSHGVNSQRIVTLGAGEGRPVASNDNADGRQQNRRVELKLQPITQG